MYSLDVYDSAFFSTNQWEGLRHAEWFCPLLVEIFHPKSLVDIGCGTGHFLRWCLDHHIRDVVGLEGSLSAHANALVGCIDIWDLRYPYKPMRKYDLAISIEVAEHIEEEFAGTFVDTLVQLSDCVVLTAAPPGQGGFHHVNEQPWVYWRDLFRARGYAYDAVASAGLKDGIQRARVAGEHVASWFLPNIMCFRRRAECASA